jgi:hypothetical protein
MRRPPQAAAERPQAACAVRCRKAVILDPGQDLATLARGAAADGADVLGAAGGDESLAVVAAVAGSGSPHAIRARRHRRGCTSPAPAVRMSYLIIFVAVYQY